MNKILNRNGSSVHQPVVANASCYSLLEGVLPTSLCGISTLLGVGITLTILVLWRVHIVSDKFDYYGKYNKILQIYVVIIIEWPHYKNRKN